MPREAVSEKCGINMTKTDFSRSLPLFGESGQQRLFSTRVAVFGVGGVGGYVVEALARSGIGAIDLIDSDVVSPSNLNRQIIATHSTIGQKKVDVAAARIRDIHPDCVVRTHPVFYLPENADDFDLTAYDYVVDAIDTVSAKLALIERAVKANTPIISCMGAGNKLDASAFTVTDIYKTVNDPLARVIRTELRRRGIRALKVVYSPEPPIPSTLPPDPNAPTRRSVPGSCSFVPAAAGMVLAGAVIRDLIGRG